MLAVLVLLLIGFAALSAVLGRRLADEHARLRQITAAAKRVAAGESHVTLPVRGEDDLSSLAASVNALVEIVRHAQLDQAPDRVFDQAMVRETPNGLLVVDGQGRVRRYNPAFARLVPIEGDPVGKPPIESIPVSELQAVVDEAARTRTTAERPGTVGKRDLLFRGIPLADGQGTMGVVLDITSVREAERARRDFVANVSHELRTPITAIVGFSETLLDEEVPEHVRPMVETIDRNARRLQALVTDVLQLSKIEARREDFPLELEALAPMVHEVADRLAPAAAARGVELTVDVPEGLQAQINAEALEHALANLVDNAIKYTPRGGRVHVYAEGDGDKVNLNVADTGIGIDAVHHARIFERFYRVDAGRSREAGGTGLGLALVKHLCLAMRTDVTFASKPGEGTTFTLKLPR